MKPIISVENMRKSDAQEIATRTSGRELMYRASMGIYKSVSWGGRIGIVCGTGNNAGDGYALALILKENGYEPELILIKEKLSIDGEYYFEMCKNAGISVVFSAEKENFSEYSILVDCILGTGFVGEPRDEVRRAIEKINESGAYVVSADINSGLNGDTGLAVCAVKSDITVSIGTLKTGHILAQAKDLICKLVNVDIGIPLAEKPMYLVEGEDCKVAFAKRPFFSHKGTYGYATLIGGSLEYSGAIKLANIALSAMRSGAGVIRLATAKSIACAVTPHLLESTFYPLDDENGHIKFNPVQIDGALKGVKAVAIGMGIGQDSDAYEIIEHILKNYEIPLVIDADGLNALSKGDMSILKNTKCSVILTPHLGEFERLSGISVAKILENPTECAREFARKYNVTLLLKGTATIVTDGEEIYLINRGASGMATAGSGDVLSGILLGLCAQNNAPTSQIVNAYTSAYINGLAGELASQELGDISMLSSDTASKIPQAISQIINS